LKPYEKRFKKKKSLPKRKGTSRVAKEGVSTFPGPLFERRKDVFIIITEPVFVHV
jgi:hypothetical protein